MFKRFSPEQIECMLDALAKRLSEKELTHALYTAETASQLASIYGADEELAYVAGLLHDWDKEESSEELFKKAERFCIKIDEFNRKNPKLLHEKTGSASVHEYFLYEISEPFDLGDRVVGAIARHTLAATDMSDLDMVIYVADMIEPTRDYGGVEGLRELVGSIALEALFMQALAKTLESLVVRRRTIHPQSLEVWNSYVSKGENSTYAG